MSQQRQSVVAKPGPGRVGAIHRPHDRLEVGNSRPMAQRHLKDSKEWTVVLQVPLIPEIVVTVDSGAARPEEIAVERRGKPQ